MTRLRAPIGGGVTVRAYRHGFGDCLLLAFSSTAEEPTYVLVDCGLFWAFPSGSDRLESVAANIRDATGGRLEALVISHEHYDHVAGFNSKRSLEILRGLDIDELWLPWTEDPKDDTAKEYREEIDRELTALRGFALSRGFTDNSPIGQLLAFSKNTDRALKNAVAMFHDDDRRVLDGKRVRYFDPGQSFLVPKGGPRVYVLGPPKDRTLLRKNFSAGHAYHDHEEPDHDPAVLVQDRAGTDPLEPFAGTGTGTSYAVGESGGPFLDAFYGSPSPPKKGAGELQRAAGHAEPWRRIDDASPEAIHSLALQYDGYVNNTSLVLAFELRSSKKVLLFPGDAQLGNWMSWDSVRFRGAVQDQDAKKLLERTVFYKVGHHGSHNATAKDIGLERMTSDELVAVIPTDESWAWSEPRNWTMPYMPIYLRLLERAKGRVVQTVEGLPTQKQRQPAMDEGAKLPYTDAQWQKRAELVARFAAETAAMEVATDDLWVDFFVHD